MSSYSGSKTHILRQNDQNNVFVGNIERYVGEWEIRRKDSPAEKPVCPVKRLRAGPQAKLLRYLYRLILDDQTVRSIIGWVVSLAPFQQVSTSLRMVGKTVA